jgi:2-polyprenyl-3-methyl-5-hydroxy-6-metoxy-1,4-benzoquinol methylase
MVDLKMAELGSYEKKQLHCRSRIITWSHSSRFRLARELVKPFASQSILDYGCGDGTFLKSVSESFRQAVGADVSEEQILDCQRRFSKQSVAEFLTIGQLNAQYPKGHFAVVTCMEVLEHCPGGEAEKVLGDLAGLVQSEGVVIISVPIETGPTLLAKQTVRKIAGWRGLGDYKWTEQYSLKELLKMSFAGGDTAIKRPVYGESMRFHGHKGFNWRILEKRIGDYLQIKRRLFTPLGFMGSFLNSQVWFICGSRLQPGLSANATPLQ